MGFSIFRAVAFVLLCLPTLLCAQEGNARAQLEAFSDGLDTLQAEFTQAVVGTDGVVQDASAGTVWLQRPDLFRWEYGGDFPEVVVADGKSIWIYDEVLEQATVKDQLASSMNSPLSLLTDAASIDEQFEVREAGALDGLALLELRSRSEEVEFERVLLGLESNLIVLMILEDAFGLRTELRFGDVQRNPQLESGLFEFTPPEGTDVLGDLPKGMSDS